MNATELEKKLQDANLKVEKRIGTIEKICKRLDVRKNKVMELFNAYVGSEYDFGYLSNRDARTIVSEVVEEKPYRDEQGNWLDDAYDFNDKVHQLADNLSKLYDVKKIANSWEEKLNKQRNKENAEKIPAIWNFLCEWEVKAIDWYKKNAELFFNLKKTEDSDLDDYKSTDEYQEKLYKKLNYYLNNSVYVNKYGQGYIEDRTISNLEQEWKDLRYENVSPLTVEITNIGYKYSGYTVDEEKLTKTVAQEKLNKYFDLVNRITKEVGEITDASHLSIGDQKGELNGLVEGTKGTCKVSTISAGGYNIQCFHYRVLVHKIK